MASVVVGLAKEVFNISGQDKALFLRVTLVIEEGGEGGGDSDDEVSVSVVGLPEKPVFKSLCI